MRGGRRVAPSIVLVTDPRLSLEDILDVVRRAAAALPPGALLVQLRDKAADETALAASARVVRAVTSETAASFVVNVGTTRGFELARAVGADGVHVPLRLAAEAREQVPGSGWVSVPAHTDEDVALAVTAGVTGLLVSPIWDTPGKGPPRGVAALRAARAIVTSSRSATRLNALGGVDESRAAACATAGADGVAVIRALLDARDPGAVARQLDAPFQPSREVEGQPAE